MKVSRPVETRQILRSGFSQGAGLYPWVGGWGSLKSIFGGYGAIKGTDCGSLLRGTALERSGCMSSGFARSLDGNSYGISAIGLCGFECP